jgi:hypothetical protein
MLFEHTVIGRNREAGYYLTGSDHVINENKLWQNYYGPKQGIAKEFVITFFIINIRSVLMLSYCLRLDIK